MSVYVPLRSDVMKALHILAEREQRDPRRQAARLVEEGLIRAGLLVGEPGASVRVETPSR
jgi:hypothetical protein